MQRSLQVALLAAFLTLVSPALASAPQVAGRAYLVENATTGDVVAQLNAHDRVPIASITKLMTAVVVLEHARLDDVVRVSPLAADVGESTVYLRDFGDFAEFNTVYSEYFPTEPPTRATVGVTALAADFRIEIEVIAVR